MADDDVISEMQRLREALRRANSAKSIDYQALSRSMGKNQTYIQQFVTRGTPRILHAHHAAAAWQAIAEGERAIPTAKESTGKVSGRSAIIALLKTIDGLPANAIEPVYGVIAGFLNQADASQRQSQLRDQS